MTGLDITTAFSNFIERGNTMNKVAKFNHTAHKELWNWLAQNPDKQKRDWGGWEENGGEYQYGGAYEYCFACDYENERNDYWQDSDDGCRYCPLAWTEDNPCTTQNSLYLRWIRENNLEQRAKLAVQIRDLPVKEGVECI